MCGNPSDGGGVFHKKGESTGKVRGKERSRGRGGLKRHPSGRDSSYSRMAAFQGDLGGKKVEKKSAGKETAQHAERLVDDTKRGAVHRQEVASKKRGNAKDRTQRGKACPCRIGW